MRKFFVLATVLAVGLATAACDIQTSANGEFSFDIAQGKATDTWSRTYKVAANGRFELINVNGRITAESTDGAEVVVEGRRTAKGRSDEAAKELLAKLEIREEVGDSTVRVESRPPRFNGGFNGHEIEWTIKVPKGVTVDLRTVNGGVPPQRPVGEIHAKTTNGGVKGMGIIPTVIEASVGQRRRQVRAGVAARCDGFRATRDRQRRRRAGAAVGEQGHHHRALRQRRRARRWPRHQKDEQGNEFERKRRP